MKLLIACLAAALQLSSPMQWQLSKVGEDRWIPAPVPGTVAVAYRDAGLMEDIRYDDNLTRIDDGWYLSDFEYRTSFATPQFGGRLILNFDGINWKAEVSLNGREVGRIDGAFARGRFDITDYVNRSGEDNELRVLVRQCANPGEVKIPTLTKNVPNGGVLGLDNPTFHASIGWDWIPTMPGRNIGIWNDVFLSEAPASVAIEDVFFDTVLSEFAPKPQYATMEPCLTFCNYSSGILSGTVEISFGPEKLYRRIDIKPGRQDITLDSFRLKKPRLWWPNKYGEAYLYDVAVSWRPDGADRPAAEKHLKCGVRQMKYTLESSALQIYINGRRFIPYGGNWGFSELNLQYDAAQYDAALRMHNLMNFNMVRNWVGQVGDEEFYLACDKYGIMVWQDFCLANPSDGPNPADWRMFVRNADDLIHRVRPHACVGLWCARNEGVAPTKIETRLNRLVSTLCPRSLYIPCSSKYCVSGHGPYRAMPPVDYFRNVSALSGDTPVGDNKFHSERGAPCIPSYESLCRMFRPEHRWPQNDVWAMHNFTLAGAQKCETFNTMLNEGLGAPESLKEFSDKAQYINFNTYRAMFESRSSHRNGLLLWMSHPAWPCLVFQTYDYWMDVNAAVFACRRACSPIRVQYNPLLKCIEVVNDCAGNQNDVSVRVRIFNQEGVCVEDVPHRIGRVGDDATVKVCDFSPEAPSDVYYVKLELFSGRRLLADNFYWEGRQEGNWKAMKRASSSQISCLRNEAGVDGELYRTCITLTNTSSLPAPMVRVSLQDGEGKQILPVYYEDNYLALLPGQTRTIFASSPEKAAKVVVESL